MADCLFSTTQPVPGEASLLPPSLVSECRLYESSRPLNPWNFSGSLGSLFIFVGGFSGSVLVASGAVKGCREACRKLLGQVSELRSSFEAEKERHRHTRRCRFESEKERQRSLHGDSEIVLNAPSTGHTLSDLRTTDGI